jgi:hypothetical protein
MSSDTLANTKEDSSTLSAQDIRESLLWLKQFYAFEIPADYSKHGVGTVAAPVRASNSSELACIDRVVFILGQAIGNKTEFLATAEGKLLQAIIERGLEVNLEAVTICSAGDLLALESLLTNARASQVALNLKVLIMGDSALELARSLFAETPTSLPKHTWHMFSSGSVALAPSLQAILNEADLKKSFWELIKSIKK